MRDPKLGGHKVLRWVARFLFLSTQALGLGTVQVVLAPSAVVAQEGPTSVVAGGFLGLEGDWVGSGVLMERPARFAMRWEVLDGGFVRLAFSNMWVEEDGNTVPVLQAHAVYQNQGPSAIGVWLDDRPQRLVLNATVTDSSVVTHWIAEAEEGRTEYLVESSEVVSVRDFVSVDGSERLFAEATYRRKGPVEKE